MIVPSEETDHFSISNVLLEAFQYESLTRSVNYSELEIQTFWYDEVARIISNKDSVIQKATLPEDPTIIIGAAIFEKVDIGELATRQVLVDSILDPIEFALLEIRKSFWDMFKTKCNGRVGMESKESILPVPTHLSPQSDDEAPEDTLNFAVYRLTYLAVEKDHWNKGIAGRLVDESIRRIIDLVQARPSSSSSNSSSNNNNIIIYAESSSPGTKFICEKRGFSCWKKFKIGDLATSYSSFIESVARTNDKDRDCSSKNISGSSSDISSDNSSNNNDIGHPYGLYKEFNPVERESEIFLQVLTI